MMCGISWQGAWCSVGHVTILVHVRWAWGRFQSRDLHTRARCFGFVTIAQEAE